MTTLKGDLNDIASFNRSLKATWIKRYLDKENCGSWKSFFNLELEKYGGEVILTGNHDIKDSRSVLKCSTFVIPLRNHSLKRHWSILNCYK